MSSQEVGCRIHLWERISGIVKRWWGFIMSIPLIKSFDSDDSKGSTCDGKENYPDVMT